GVDSIDLWQLHRIDPNVPREAQFAAIARLLDRGVIRRAGFSQVSVEEIEAARHFFPVAMVQNLYNLADRSSEDVADYREREGIGFIPWFPLAAGRLAGPGSQLDSIAKVHAATPGQIALAWLVRRSPVILPIPGTVQVAHLEDNVGAAVISPDDAEFAALSEAGRR
ncbi:MAG: putative oxidoreductase, partial [Microvirga sp.]|nr:putative oxidoreductase [Microvirga sp.]